MWAGQREDTSLNHYGVLFCKCAVNYQKSSGRPHKSNVQKTEDSEIFFTVLSFNHWSLNPSCLLKEDIEFLKLRLQLNKSLWGHVVKGIR